jgi:hypothetical protein
VSKALSNLYKQIDEECSLPSEILTLVLAGKAKLWEFDEHYSTGDVFTMLELMDVESAIKDQQAKDDKAKAKRDDAKNR